MALNSIGLSRSNWDHGGHGLLAAGPGTGEEQMETSPELEITLQSRNGCDKAESSNPLPSERARRKVPSTISVPTASRKPLEHDKASVSQSNLFGEDYKTRVPKKRWCARCRNFLSVYSWIFLSLAFVQIVIVTGLQIVIVIKGDFRSEPAEDYVGCTAKSLKINSSVLEGTSIPSFGKDKEVYIYLFILSVVYNFLLCLYALKARNIVEIYTFLLINVLTCLYAILQVYQLRGFGDECETITTVGYYALGNVLVLSIFTVLFGILLSFIYVEFGWKLSVKVHCDAKIRRYYRWYTRLMSAVKLLILFTVIFSIVQCILLLQDTYETWLTIVLILFAIAWYPILDFIVHRETHSGSVIVLFVGLLSVAYYTFKVVRYSQRSCPLCKEAVEDSDRTRETVRNLTNVSVSEIDGLIRGEVFEHLILFGLVNALTTIATIVVFICVWRNYGKGLREKYWGRDPQPLSLGQSSSRQSRSTDSERDSQLWSGRQLDRNHGRWQARTAGFVLTSADTRDQVITVI